MQKDERTCRFIGFLQYLCTRFKRNDYEAIRRISALRREHHEGQGL